MWTQCTNTKKPKIRDKRHNFTFCLTDLIFQVRLRPDRSAGKIFSGCRSEIFLQIKCCALEDEASKIGLVINPDKCKVMATSAWDGRSDIQAAGSDIEQVNDFCYLGTYISYNFFTAVKKTSRCALEKQYQYLEKTEKDLEKQQYQLEN